MTYQMPGRDRSHLLPLGLEAADDSKQPSALSSEKPRLLGPKVEAVIREVVTYWVERAAMMISDWAQRRGGNADALAYGEHRYADLVFELRSGRWVGPEAPAAEVVPARMRGTYGWDADAETFAAKATTAEWLAFIDQVGEWIVSAPHRDPEVMVQVGRQRTLYLSLDLGDRDGWSA